MESPASRSAEDEARAAVIRGIVPGASICGNLDSSGVGCDEFRVRAAPQAHYVSWRVSSAARRRSSSG